jgi:hypothetical protein
MVAINSGGNLSEFSNADMVAGVDGIPDGCADATSGSTT